MTNNNQKISTLFKYIGGKTWLRKQLRDTLQVMLEKKQYNHYLEPFAGGLGAFLNVYDILLSHNIKNITLNDINKQIVYFYKTVQTAPQLLIEQYNVYENGFIQSLPAQHLINDLHKIKDKADIKLLLKDSNDYYKSIRTQYNTLKKSDNIFSENSLITKEQVAICAMFLFLQNHSFNGVYRENSKGEHNTPFNWDNKSFSSISITEKIMAVHHIFSLFNIVFSHTSYNEIDYSLNGIYYLDPPYINENGLVENQYNVDAFTIKEQEQLIKHICNTSFIYSNHESHALTQFFKQYMTQQYTVTKVNRKNIMSASAKTRSEDKIEILVNSDN